MPAFDALTGWEKLGRAVNLQIRVKLGGTWVYVTLDTGSAWS